MISSQYFIITGTASVFASNRHIASKQHCSVWTKSLSNVWSQLPYSNYDLVNNSIILNTPILNTLVSQVEVRVADSQEELGTPVNDISIVAANIEFLQDNIDDIANAAENAQLALQYRNEVEEFANSINPDNIVHISGTETITGNKTFSGTLTGTLTGSATSLATSRDITIGSTTKSFNGTANVSWNLSEIDSDLNAISGLSGTNGVLRKTNTDTWTLDTSTFITTSNDFNLDLGGL